MIYISSSCVKKKKIKDVILTLVKAGFKNIELSGGTDYYLAYLVDLLELKAKYDLNYLVHNYFPPPEEAFVMNIASSDPGIYNKTIAHIEKAIELSRHLGATRYGFHAGFLVDISLKQLGGEISKTKIFKYEEALDKFKSGHQYLCTRHNDIKIYLENNVLSQTNYNTYSNSNPFFLTDYQSYKHLYSIFNFNLLLDIGHLKVTSQVLRLDFKAQLNKLIGVSNYLHLSDNDGKHDLNWPLVQDSELCNILSTFSLKNKTITLEIYATISEIEKSYQFIESLL